MKQKTKKQLNKPLDVKVIVVVFVAVVLVLLVGFFASYEGGSQPQIKALEEQVSSLQGENTELKSTIFDLQGGGEERSIDVISPNGGESLCLGDNTTVRWESKGVSAVRVRLVEYRGGTSFYYYLTHSTLASSDESGEPGKGVLSWDVGEYLLGDKRWMGEIGESHSYKMELTSVDGGTVVSDLSDDVFSLLKCEG